MSAQLFPTTGKGKAKEKQEKWKDGGGREEGG